MRRDQVKELHCITPIANVQSILQHGLLSHSGAAHLQHVSVAREAVQDIRDGKRVPGGLPLHQHANLYFSARNPMMSVLRDRHRELCVLRVASDVLDLPNAVVADRNAAVRARFAPAPQGLEIVNDAVVFADRWTGGRHALSDTERKQIKCAEVLVPHCVDPIYIRGAYVSSLCSGLRLQQEAPQITVAIEPHLFFQETVPWPLKFALEAFLKLRRRRSSTL